MTTPSPSERVLSTLNEDGSRHWLRPRLAKGRVLARRRVVGYGLIALFVVLPFIEIGGRPALLMDLVTRELSVFGAVFRPTDGFLLMLLGLTIAVAVFLVTALFGRVWCGWGCPQTVYLELVFRPIERRLERTKLPGQAAIRWAIYVVLSLVLANVFLAYFVGVERLGHWVLGSPLDHPVGFGTVVGVAALVLFDFGYFREQTCIVACPYGRLQSVLLDRQSLIVGYDARRGEPRAKPKKKLPVIEQRGDCVACNACVQVCPTGIDIREGLQMECIGCAQCIDACDTVMAKVGKPLGLIGYTSQDQLAGKARRVLRARTIIYPALLMLFAALLVVSVGSRPVTTISIGRVVGPSFVELPDGQISAAVQLKIENGSDARRSYQITVRAPDAALRSQPRWEVAAHRALDISLYIDVPRTSFAHGRRSLELAIEDGAGLHRVITVTLLGPEGARP